MRHVRWSVLFAAVVAPYACTPFLGPHVDAGTDPKDSESPELGTPPNDDALGPASSDQAPGPDPRPGGADCTGDAQCGTGHCVDGVCCATASCPACQACNLNQAGTCSSKPRGALDAACPPSATTCSAGACDGASGCLSAPSGTTCGRGVCQNGNASFGQWT